MEGSSVVPLQGQATTVPGLLWTVVKAFFAKVFRGEPHRRVPLTIEELVAIFREDVHTFSWRLTPGQFKAADCLNAADGDPVEAMEFFKSHYLPEKEGPDISAWQDAQRILRGFLPPATPTP
jgi:hypothetical protein